MRNIPGHTAEGSQGSISAEDGLHKRAGSVRSFKKGVARRGRFAAAVCSQIALLLRPYLHLFVPFCLTFQKYCSLFSNSQVALLLKPLIYSLVVTFCLISFQKYCSVFSALPSNRSRVYTNSLKLTAQHNG